MFWRREEVRGLRGLNSTLWVRVESKEWLLEREKGGRTMGVEMREQSVEILGVHKGQVEFQRVLKG